MVHADITAIQIDPPTSMVTEGDSFTVNLTIDNVITLYIWEIHLLYLNSLVNCQSVAEGPFLKQGGATWFAHQIENTYNSTHGRAVFGCTLLGPISGVNGTGTLGFATFQAIGIGETPLHLENTLLEDDHPPPRNPIPHTSHDGLVIVTGVEPPHDVAVIEVSTSKTRGTPMPTVGQGQPARVNATVQNQGGHTETFNVTAYANETSIGKQQITLNALEVTTITFVWDTTGFVRGDYTVRAEADIVLNESDTADNAYLDGTVRVVLPGDIDGSGEVDIFDAIVLAGAFGDRSSDVNWNPNADINDDDIIDIFDAIILASNFGAS